MRSVSMDLLRWIMVLDKYTFNLMHEKGQPLMISGKESMVCTHTLRSIHDGILVGINTVLVDNPSLTTRYVKGL